MTNTMDKMRKSSLAGKGSKAKERFKMAKQGEKESNRRISENLFTATLF